MSGVRWGPLQVSCMWSCSFPNTVYLRDCLLPTDSSWLSHQILVDSVCEGLHLGSRFCLIGLSVCLSVSERVFSHVWLFATLWTADPQAPLSVGFSRQEYWRRLPFPSPGDLPDPGIKPALPASPALQVDTLWLSCPGSLLCQYHTVFITLTL